MKVIYLMFIILCVLCGCRSGANKQAFNNYDGQRYPKTSYCEVKMFHTQFWLDKYLQEEFNPNEYAMVGSSNWTSKTGLKEKHAIKICKNLGGDLAIFLDEGVKFIDSYNATITTYSTRTANSTYRSSTNYYNSRNSYIGNTRTSGNVYTTYQQPEYYDFHKTTFYSGYVIVIFKRK